MPDPIAEAFVGIRPDFSGFQAQLQSGVNSAFKNLKVPQGTQQGLAGQMFGPGFVQQSQQNVSNATKNAKVPPSTQRTLAQSLFGSAFRDESGRALQGVLSGAGLGNIAAQAAFFGPGGAAIAIGTGALVGATVAAADFDRQLNILRATTDATDEQMRQAEDAARDLGRSLTLPGVSATDAANAITELAKAGLTMKDAIAGVAGTLSLAVAAQIDTGTAAQITASALNAFSLAGEQAGHVADLLAGASIAAQGDIGDMALSLQQSAAVADQAGLSIEQLVGFITELAKQGILGSDAGTSIRTMLLRLTPTTKEAAQIMEALGIQLDRTRTLGEQLPDLLDQYQRALSRLDPITRQQALTQIFGTDAIRAATIAFEQGAAGLQKNTDAANKSGAANKLAGAQAQGAAGSFQELGDATTSLGITLGSIGLPAVELFTDSLTNMVIAADNAITALEDLADTELPGGFSLGGAFGSVFKDAFLAASPLLGTFKQLGEGVRALSEGDLKGLAKSLAGLSLPARTILQITDALRDMRDAGNDANDAVKRMPVSIRKDAGSAFQETGKQLGLDFGHGVADGITESEQRTIDAARRNLENLRRTGQDQITEAVRSARSNLESLGSSLSSELEDIIDVGPIAEQIKEINKQLDALEERTTRRDLRFDLSDAERDLKDAKDAISEVNSLPGKLTPAQKRQQEEFLEPFKRKVGDAKAALKEFDLTDHREDLQKTLDLQKKTAEEGLQKLIDKFERGKLTVGEFSTALQTQLAPQLATLNRQHNNLGFVFTRDFKRDLATVVQQAKDLAGFLGRAGTTPGPQSIKPAQTVQDVQRQLADAERALSQAIKDAKAKNTEENGQLAGLLARIARAVEGNPRGQPGGSRG